MWTRSCFCPLAPGLGLTRCPGRAGTRAVRAVLWVGKQTPPPWSVWETGPPAQALLLIWGAQVVYMDRGTTRNHVAAHVVSPPPGRVSGAPGLDCLGSHGGFPGAQSQDCIAAALACSKILKELSKEEEDTDSLEEMLALADEFEHRAVGELAGAGLGPRPGSSRAAPGSSSLVPPRPWHLEEPVPDPGPGSDTDLPSPRGVH